MLEATPGVARSDLVLPEGMRPQPFVNLLNRLGHPTKTRWNVRIMERYRHGARGGDLSRPLMCAVARSRTRGWWPATASA